MPRRCVIALVVALAVIAACGSPPGPTDEEARVGDYLDTRVTTTLPGSAALSPAASPSTVSPLTTAPPGTGPRGPATTIDIGQNPPPAQPTGDRVYDASRGNGGSAAGMILQTIDAPNLIIELIAQSNARFVDQAIDRVIADLRQFSGKRAEVVRTAAPNGNPSQDWTGTELLEYTDQHAARKSGGDTFVLHFLAVRGEIPRDDGFTTLGVAIRADTFVYLQDSNVGLDGNQIRALFVHETGHLLGLVDLYLSRNRHDTAFDPAKRGHSKNPKSVMYYAVQPALNLGNPFNTASDQFDAQDIRDLQAIKAGAPPGSNPKL